MTGNQHKVAITGIGIISSLGNSIKDVTKSLKEGNSGIILDEKRREKGFRSALTGSIKDFDPKQWGLNKKKLRTMCEPAQYAFAAACDAVKDAGLKDEHLKGERSGLIFGNDSTINASVESIDTVHKYGETRFVGSGQIFRAMNSTVSMNLAAHFGIQGANWTLSAACASGLHSAGQALMLIRSGLQDIVVTGGSQETNWKAMASFDALGAFSIRHDSPEKASRPFDADRDGIVTSGGAACLVIESLEHAINRSAEIYAIIDGYGFSSGIGANLSEPSVAGVTMAMKHALADAGRDPSEVDYINAHATSTQAGDIVEARAINDIFGKHVPVSSTKSMTGHECWMAGASELIYTILMAKKGFIAPNINFFGFQDEFPEINIISKCTPAEINIGLSNSFGFGGTNGSILLDFTKHRI